jgi:dipicolinate synthase subunit B
MLTAQPGLNRRMRQKTKGRSSLEDKTIGFAVCGSFCTHAKAMEALEQVKARFQRVVPIVSETAADTDTRFGTAHDLMREMERICDHRVIRTVKGAEPIGPQKLLDLLIIAPCTGNTLGKLAAGVTDTSVTMAAKAHLRNCRPLLIAPSTNDGLSASAASIGALLPRKYIYFVPFGQDDFEKKPTSLVADFSQVADAASAALEGRQLQPLLLRA